MTKCPDRVVIEQLLRGTLPADSQLTEHLRHCPSCQALLEQMVSDPELESWRAVLANNSHQFDSHLCSELIERFQKKDTPQEKQLHSETPIEPPRTISSEIRPGTMVNHYRVVKEVGRGGMSIVFEAVDTRIQRSVALKLMLGDLHHKHAEARFLRECMAIASVRHPNVVTVYEADPSPAIPYLAMELVHGETMRDWIARKSVPDLRQSAELIAKVADGLQAAHSAGVLHRDIKPGNILISSSNAFDKSIVPKLADFGLARPLQADSQLTASGYLAGTPAYASPEQITTPERLDPTSDIYALGATLYESITGATPYRGSAQAVIQQIVDGELVAPHRLNNSIPKDLETICLKAMHHDSKLRYATAAELAADLRRWLDGKTILARPASNWERAWRWANRNRRVAALTAAVATLLLVIAIGSTSMLLVLRSKNKQLEEEVSNTRIANEKSVRSAEIAMEQRALALDSLNELTHEVQVQLSTRPGLLKLREEVLRTALRGLERITESADRNQLERITIAAHLQSAQIFESIREVTKSKEHIDKAVELSQRALAADPNNIDFTRDLANSIAVEAGFYGTTAADKREELLLNELDLRKKIVEREPDDLKTNLVMIGTIQQIADLKKYQWKYEPALSGFEEARVLLEALSKKHVDNRDLMLERCINHNRIGSVLGKLNRFDEADVHLQAALKLCDTLVELEPDHIRYQETIAYILQTLARRRLATRDLAAALPLAHRANLQYQKLADADESNVNAQSLVGTGSYLLYEVLIAMGRTEEACLAAETAAQRQEKLALQHPDAIKDFLLTAQAWNAVADAQLRLGNISAAIESQQKTVRMYQEAEKAKDYSPKPWKYVLEISQELEAAIRLTFQGEEAIQAILKAAPSLPESDSYVARLALVLLFYESARSSQLELAVSLGKELQSTKPEKQRLYQLIYAARAYGITLGKLQADGQNSEIQSQLVKGHLLETVTDLLRLGGTKETLVDIDFESIRQDKDFQKLLTK